MNEHTVTLRLKDDDHARLKYAARHAGMSASALLRTALAQYVAKEFPNGLLVHDGIAIEAFDPGVEFDDFVQAALLMRDPERAVCFAVIASHELMLDDDRMADQYRNLAPAVALQQNRQAVEAINKAFGTNLPATADLLSRIRAVASQPLSDDEPMAPGRATPPMPAGAVLAFRRPSSDRHAEPSGPRYAATHLPVDTETAGAPL